MTNIETIKSSWNNEDKDRRKLFFISNSGCDDTTRGLAFLNYEEFTTFVNICSNLNNNSTYCCMPTISLEETKWEYFEEVSNWEKLCEERSDLSDSDLFLWNKKYYTFKEGFNEYNIDIHADMRCYKIPPKVNTDLIGF